MSGAAVYERRPGELTHVNWPLTPFEEEYGLQSGTWPFINTDSEAELDEEYEAADKARAPRVIPFPSRPTVPHRITIVQQQAPTASTAFDLVTKDGKLVPRSSQQNICEALRRLRVQMTFNEFNQQAFVVHTNLVRRKLVTEPLSDMNENELWLALDRHFDFLPPRELFRAVLLNQAHRNSFHPVREYLDNLRWDGTPRIDHWLIALAGADDTPYVRAVSALVLIAAVRRVRQPGVKFDEMLVLEGGQGIEKSSGLRAMCPSSEWFSDSLPLNATPKEVIEQTAGRWLIEVAELSGISNAKVELLKAMLSRQEDSARLAYGHHRIDTKRQWVAFGTTNDSQYLRDDTGNRRFWPIKVQRFNVRAVVEQRDQLWAEAAQRESSGESIRLVQGLWQDAAVEQEQRQVVDPWEDELRHNLAIHTWPNGLKRVSRRDLFGWVGKNIAHANREDNRRMKAIMIRLGWKSMTVSVNGKPEQGYGQDP